MKQFGRKLISSMLALIMVISLFPVNVLAADEGEMLDENGMVITAPAATEEIQIESEEAAASEELSEEESVVQEETIVQEETLETSVSAMNSGEEDVYSGDCGDSASYELVDGVLNIFGSGAMDDYADAEDAPWSSVSDEVKSVVIDDGITAIGENAFAQCAALSSVVIAESVTYIGADAFSGTALANVHYEGTVDAWKSVEGSSEIGSAKIHCVVIDEAKEPTCTEYGLTEGSHCSGCDDIFVAQTIIPAAGHAWDDGKITTEPTNTTAGVKTYTCLTCGETKTSTFTGTAPELKSAENSAEGVVFTWYSVEDAAKYQVLRMSGTGSSVSILGTTEDTTYVDSKATEGVLYRYTVRCLDENDNVISGYDAEGKSIVRLAQPLVSGIEGTSNGVKITWKAAIGADTYRVYLLKDESWTKLTEVSGTSYTYSSASSNNEYTFMVRAVSGGYLSGNENTVSIFYVAAPSLSSVNNVSNGVEFRWTAVNGADGYMIYRKGGSNTAWTVIGESDTNTFVDETAQSGVKYSYTVACMDDEGNKTSGYNTTGLSITYVAQPGFRSLTNVYGGVKLTWSTVPGAASYRIYQVTDSGLKTLATVTGTSYTYSEVTSGKEYTFAIRCLDSAGASVSACDEAGQSIVYVAAPEISKIKNAEGGVSIEWNEVKGASGYRVLVKNEDSWEAVGDTTETGFVYSEAVSGESCTLSVRCLDEEGNYASGYNTTGKSIVYYKAPTLRSASNTADGIQIRWYTVSGAASYRIYRMGGSVTEFKVLADSAATSYVDTTVKSGVEYVYTVACLDAAGTVISAYDAAGVSVLRVNQPEINKISNTAEGVSIEWKAVNGAALYRVYLRVDGSWEPVADVEETKYLHTAVNSGDTYTFTVRALDEEGNELSSYNAAGTGIQYIAQPMFAALKNETDGIKLSWNKVDGAYGYRLLMKIDGSWEPLEPIIVDTSCKFTAAESGEEYIFTLRCVDAAGNYVSTYDEVGQSITFYAAPVLKSAQATVEGIRITWNDVDGAYNYCVLRKGGSVKSWQPVATVNDDNYLDTAISSGVKYTYTVVCVDEEGNYISGYNTTGKSATFATAPEITALENNYNGVKISWGKVDGATKYRVVMKVGETDNESWVTVGETTALNYTFKGAVNKTKYVFAVCAYDGAWSGHDETGSEITFFKHPEHIGAENVYGGIQFSWEKIDGAYGYRVFRKTGSGSYAALEDVFDTEYVDKTAEAGVKYTYTVACIDEDGKKISGYYSSGTKIEKIGEAEITALTNTYNGVEIAWAKVSGATKYRVMIKEDGVWVKLAETTSTKYTHKYLIHGETYEYAVCAYDGAWGSYNTKGSTIEFCKHPEHEKISNVYGGVKFTWESVDGVDNYRVYRKGGDSSSYVKIADVMETEYVDTSAQDGVKYTYTVACLDSEGKKISGYYNTGSAIKRVGEPDISAVTNTYNGIKISWDKVKGATKYRVLMKVDGSWLKVADTTSTSYTYKNPEHGTVYTFTVRAYDGSWGGYHTDVDSIVYIRQPDLKSISNVSDGIKFVWEPVSGVEGYRVYRKGGDDKSYVVLDTVFDNEFVDETVEDGVKYTYTVACADEEGNKISGYYSTGISLKRVGEPEITALTNTYNGVQITWDKVKGATKYRIMIKVDGEWVKLAETTSTKYTHKNLENGKEYEYTVRAYAGSWGSYDTAGSSIVFIKHPEHDGISNVVGGIKFSWEAVDGAIAYRVYRKGGDDKSYVVLENVSSLSYVDTTAKNGVTYTYTVACLDDEGNKISGYYSAGSKLKRIGEPEISSIANTYNGIKLTWGKVSGATKYRVYVMDDGEWVKVKDTTSTTYTYTAAKNGKEYKFTVRAYAAGWGCYDDAGVSIVFVKTPDHDALVNTTEGVKFSWKAVGDVSEYIVYRKGGDSKNYEVLDVVTETSYLDETAESGVKYTYTVACAEEGRKISGYYSAGSSITRVDQPEIINITNNYNGVKITWGKVKGATKYRVMIKVEDTWKKLAETSSTSYTYTGVKNGESYELSVSAYAKSWSSYNTEVESHTFFKAPDLKKVTNTEDGVKFTWAAVEGASGYAVYRKGGSSSAYVRLDTVTGTSYVDETAKNGVKYTYTVACVDEDDIKISGYLSSGKSITCKK